MSTVKEWVSKFALTECEGEETRQVRYDRVEIEAALDTPQVPPMAVPLLLARMQRLEDKLSLYEYAQDFQSTSGATPEEVLLAYHRICDLLHAKEAPYETALPLLAHFDEESLMRLDGEVLDGWAKVFDFATWCLRAVRNHPKFDTTLYLQTLAQKYELYLRRLRHIIVVLLAHRTVSDRALAGTLPWTLEDVVVRRVAGMERHPASLLEQTLTTLLEGVQSMREPSWDEWKEKLLRCVAYIDDEKNRKTL